MPETLGSRMHLMREAKEWSFGYLAKESGLTKAYLVKMEKDNCNPSVDVISKLAHALSCSPGWLAFGVVVK